MSRDFLTWNNFFYYLCYGVSSHEEGQLVVIGNGTSNTCLEKTTLQFTYMPRVKIEKKIHLLKAKKCS